MIINNYSVTETSEKIVVDYTKSAKDWFDTILTLAFGLCLIKVSVFFLHDILETKSWVQTITGLIIAFAAVLQTLMGLSRLFQPTNKVLIINKKSLLLILKKVAFTSKTIPISTVRTFVVGKHEDKLIHGHRMIRNYCTIDAQLKDGTRITLLTINTTRFIRVSAKILEKEIYSSTRKLTMELNHYLHEINKNNNKKRNNK